MPTSESEPLTAKIGEMIALYNTYCAIEETFCNSKILSEYFDKAKEEVIKNGNCGLGMIYSRALKNLATALAIYKEDHGPLQVDIDRSISEEDFED